MIEPFSPDWSPFLDGCGPRRSPEQIAGWARATYGVALVAGFGQMRAACGATVNDVRVASFMEFGRNTAWYVGMGGQQSAPRPRDREVAPGLIGAAEARYVEWTTAPLPDDLASTSAVVFVFAMGLGNGSPLPQPNGWFELRCNGRRLLSFRTTKYRQMWQAPPTDTGGAGMGARLLFDVRRLEAAPPGQALWLDAVIGPESWAAYGLGMLYVPLEAGILRAGVPAVLRVTPCSRVPSTRWFKLDNARETLFQTNFYSGLAEVCRAERTRPAAAEGSIYFGDLHTHTGEPDGTGCGTGTVEENYDYARDVAALDFYCLSEHDKQIHADADWERLLAFCDAYDVPRRFATIPGYEFTNRTWGHRDVYFADTRLAGQPPPYTSARPRGGEGYVTPERLWARLDEAGLQGRALTVPHHPSCASHPFNWAHFDPRYDRLVEIYSSWGNAETPGNRYQGTGSDRYPQHFVRPQWDRGLRFGVIGSSDGHDGCPGDAQSPHTKHHHIYHHLGSGRAAVIAPDLSRASVFAALYTRRCYATTGAPIGLEVRCNDRPMGSALTPAETGRHPRLDVRVVSPLALTRVEVIRGRSPVFPTVSPGGGEPGRVVYRHPCDDDPTSAAFTWHDPANEAVPGTYYYVRVVLRDDEMGWSSPHWIEEEPPRRR